MLATVYQTGVLNLLDLADHEHLPPRDRLTLLRPEQPAPSRPDLLTAAGTVPDTGRPDTAPPGPLLANAQGMSLSLPYVPGRLVIEVTEPPTPNTAQPAARLGHRPVPAITALRGQPPTPGAITPAAVSFGGST